MQQISATILTFNEQRHIRDCVESLKEIADEIIVVDSNSTDMTPQICEELGCRVTRRKMAGYGAQRQYATSLTRHSYVLSLDADEVLSPALRSSLLRLKKEGFTHRGYCFSRLNFYCGIPVKHCGWYPDIQVRLFDKRYANWNIDDVEERVIFRDDITPCRIEGDILHYRCETPGEYNETERRHAMFLARLIKSSGKNINAITPYLHGLHAMLGCYISQGGMFDGQPGRNISLQRYHSTLLAWRAAREANKKMKEQQ